MPLAPVFLPLGRLLLHIRAFYGTFITDSDSSKFLVVLKTPYRKIFKEEPINQTKITSVSSNGTTEGFITLDFWHQYAHIDFYKEGIIDPYLVVKATIENAISVASTILTTNCTILNV